MAKKLDIFKGAYVKTAKTDDHQLLGAYVPFHLVHFTKLYCLAHGVTKSDVVRHSLERFRIVKTNEEKELVKLITAKVQVYWNSLKILNLFTVCTTTEQTKLFNDFKADVSFTLKKDFSTNYIKKILVKLER